MPKKNEKLTYENMSGFRGSKSFNFWLERFIFDTAEIVNRLDPDFYNEILVAYTDYESTCKDIPVKGREKHKYYNADLPQLNKEDGDEGLRNKLISSMNKTSDIYNKLYDELTPENEKFANYLDLLSLPLEAGKGDISQLFSENGNLSALLGTLAQAPKLVTKKTKVNGKEVTTVDFDKMRENLGELYEPLMDYYGCIKKLVDLEYEKQRLEKEGPDAGKEKEYLKKLKGQYQETIKVFDRLTEIELKNPGKYDDTYLNNNLDHLLGTTPKNTRDIRTNIAGMKAQVIAIDRGWGLNELPIFDYLGAVIQANDRRVMELPEQLKNWDKTIDDRKKEYEKLLETIEKTKKDPDADEDKLEELEEQEKKSKALIDKDIEARKNCFLAYTDAMRMKNATDKMKVVMDKRVRNVQQKKEIIEQIEDFADNIGGFHVGDAKTTYAGFYNNYEVGIKEIRKSLGMEERVHKPADPAITEREVRLYDTVVENERLSAISPNLAEMGRTAIYFENIIDIYGSKPKHHSSWERDNQNIIKKADFENTLKPYDASGLPFNEMEIASLSMAGTLDAHKLNRKIRNNPYMKDDKDLMANNWTLWGLDCGLEENGPRPGFEMYREIVQYGREKARNAMTAYADGNKEPLAKIIHNAFGQFVTDWKNGSTLQSNAPIYYGLMASYFDIMNRDPEMKSAVEKINNELKPEERLDLKQVENIKEAYHTRMKGLIVEKSFEDKDMYKYLSAEKKKDYMRGRIIGEAFASEKQVFSAMPKVLKAHAETDKEIEKIAMTVENNNDLVTQKSFDHMMKFAKPSKAVEYMASPEGRKEFEEFVDKMQAKYDLSPQKMEAMSIESRYADELIQYKNEISAFNFRAANKMIVNELNGPEKKPEELRELMREHMVNSFYARGCEKAAQNGVKDSFFYFYNQKDYEGLMNVREKFEGYVDRYMNNLSMDNFNNEVAATMLTDDGYLMMSESVVDNLYTAAKFDLHKENRQNQKVKDFDKGIEALENAQQGVWFGTEEYKKILEDFKKLNEDIKKTEAEYAKNPSYVNPGLAAREKDLIGRMEAYNNRKKTEIDTSKKNEKKVNENSQKRLNAMTDALKSLKERYEFDQAEAEFSAESVQKAEAEYKTLLSAEKFRKKLAEDAEKEKKADESSIKIGNSPEDHIKLLDSINKEEEKYRANTKDEKEIIKSVHRTLFNETIKDEYMQMIKENKYDKGKKIIDSFFNKKNFNANLDRFSGVFKGSAFETELEANIRKAMNDPGKSLNHDEVIEIKDKSISTVINNSKAVYENSKDKAEKKKALGNMIETANIAKIIGGGNKLKLNIEKMTAEYNKLGEETMLKSDKKPGQEMKKK